VTAIRTARAADGKFVQIANSALQDSRLSFAARGVLAYVLSLPTDHHLTAEWLEGQSPTSRRDVRAALRELAQLSYYRKTRKSGGKGKWVWEQVISDAPIEQASGEEVFPQVVSSDQFSSDVSSSDEKRSDKDLTREDPKDVGPVDMASRRARAKDASATPRKPKSQRTIQDAINGVRAAVTATNSQADADDLTDDECMGLYFTYVKGRQPTDIAAYLTKVFGDAPYIDTFRSSSEPWCCKCRKWESRCECPAA
jgi:hypothetical protein